MKQYRFIGIVLILILSLFSGYSILNTSTQAYWTLDNVLTDATGNGNTLTNTGATYNATGKINGSYSFDGVNDRMSAASGIITVQNTNSISMWIRSYGYAGTDETIINLGDGTNSFVLGVGGNEIGGFTRIGVTNRKASGILNNNSWVFVVITWDNLNDPKLYLNSVLQTGINQVGSGSGTTDDFRLGARLDNAVQFTGQIDEVSIWDRVLNSTEIEELYNSGTGLQYPYSATPPPGTPSISFNNVTLTNNTIWNTSDLEFYVEVLNTSTNGDINLSYILNNGNETLICEDCVNTTFNLLMNYTSYINPKVETKYILADIGISQMIGFCKYNGFDYVSHYKTISPINGNAVDFNIDGTYTSRPAILMPVASEIHCGNYLSDNNYNITFLAENNETSTNITYGFIVDTTAPTINNNILTEYNSYTFNPNSSCSDTNLDYCNISIDGQNVALNSTTITLTHNGNIGYNITAVDLAGNLITETGTLLVNPYQYIYFNTSSATAITNFTLGGILYEYYANISLYDYGIGTHNLLFSKIGYIDQTINLNFNTTSNINTTYIASDSTINVYIRDKFNNSIITIEEFTLEFISSVGLTTTTTTGTTTITNSFFQNENYTLFLTSDNYESETLYFEFSNKENLSITAYMIESNRTNLGYVNVFCLDEYGRGVNGGLLKALQWDNITSTFFTVSEKKADYTGRGVLNIILDKKIYRFTCDYGGDTGTIGDFNIPTSKNGEDYYITLIDSSSSLRNYVTNGISLSSSQSISADNTTTTINFNFSNDAGTDITGCIKLYYYPNNNSIPIFINKNCLTSNSGSIYKTYDISNISNIYVIKTVLDLGDKEIVDASYTHYPDTHISTILKDYYIYKWILPILVILGVALILFGSYEENKEHNGFEYVGMIFIILAFLIGVELLPSFVDMETFIMVAIISILTMLGYSKGGSK